MPKPPRPSENLKRLVAARANHRCEYCQSPQAYSTGPFEVEHILPLALGGSSEFDNLAHSCDGCNGFKHAKIAAIDPVSGQVVPLFNPRTEDWNQHFSWKKGDLKIEGRTPTGRATVLALHLNRGELVNLRTLLKLVGLHPPRLGNLGN